MDKLLRCFLIFLVSGQFLSAQADYISWEFRGGNLLNNPDGTSTGPGPEPAGLDVADIPSTPITFGRLQSAVLGDLDGDDDLDFISGSQGGTVHYYENDGTPTAPNWLAASIPTLDTLWIDRDNPFRNQNRPQLVDIDNDEDLDLFIGTDYDYEGDRNNDILFYRNVGTPETPVFEYVPEGIPGLNDIEVAEFPGLGFVDLDNDTDLDLVALGSDKLTYFLNTGDPENPVFERQSELDSPWSDEDAYTNMDVPVPVFEDFDKDGDFDMFFMIDTGFVRWIENIGTVTEPQFDDPQLLFNGELTQGEIGSFATIDFGDVNGDGLKDAILGSFNVARFAWFRQVPVCVAPSTPVVTATPVTCEGETSTITISGDLNIASTWSIYTDSCGGTLLGTTTTNTSTFEVTPTAPGTTYYIRGEDGDLTCIDETTAICVEITIPINAIDDPTFSYPDTDYCSNESNPSPTITGTTGGTFSSTSGLSIDPDTGVIDIANSTPNTYTVTYTTNGTCPDSSDQEITIIQQDDATFSYTNSSYCSNDTNPAPTITGTTGGSFSSATGLSIDPDTGVIDLANSTPAIYTVTYTTSGTCPNSSDQEITIIQQDDATFSYTDISYCSNESNLAPIITGATGGSFSAATGLSIDPNTGVIDLANSTPATYTVTYTTGGTCPNSSDQEITIIQQEDATFSYTDNSYCSNDANPTPTITGTTGGTFSTTSGLSIDPDTGLIDITDSTPDTYTVTYTTSGICPNSSDQEITILQQEDATFSYTANSYCSNDANPTPTITGTTGGIFSADSGLSIDPDTGVIDLANSIPDTYTITYTTAGLCPNSSLVEITIHPLPNVAIENDSSTISVNSLEGATYQWINCDTDSPVAGETNASFTISENGSYAVEITINGCTNRSECVTINIANRLSDFKLYPNPSEGMIHVTLPSVIDITIYNNHGRKVFETTNTSIDISTLKSGVYFMKIETSEGTTIRKLVRN